MAKETSSQGSFSIARYLLDAYDRTERSLAFRSRTVEDWRVWRIQLRTKILELMGIADFLVRCPLDPEVTERVDEGDYYRERVVYRSEPDVFVPAYVLIPKGPAKRRPALLAAHGHGHGKSSVVGVVKDQEAAAEIQKYNYDYGRQLARRGYITISPDWRCFGERSDHGGGCSAPHDGCDIAFFKAVLMGITPLGLSVWDGMRALDYIATRPEVDPERIGCVGLSYGGVMSLYLTALDDRVKVATISGYLSTFKSQVLEVSNSCGSQNLPGILKYAEEWDIAALIAPRPLLVESGTRDPYFLTAAVEEAVAKTRPAYELLGAADRLDIDVFEEGGHHHRFSGRKVFGWFDRWL